MKTITQLAMLAVFLFAAETAIAANHYIRSGAAGASNGNDWTNAYTSLPSTLVRGDTYYIAGGSYSGRTFNTPASGTSVITIKGATIADHGIDTGWSNTYAVENTQATWTSGVTFNTSYWIFDGSVGPNWSKTKSQYGFKFNPVNYAVKVYNLSSAISDVKIAHITATAPTGDVEKFFLSTDNSTKSVNNVTFSHCLVDGWSNAVWATSAGLLMNNWLIEHNVILNGYSSAANHGEDINNNYGHLDNLTIRYNWFEGRSTGTGSIVVLNGPAGPYYIYGNVFKNMIGGDGIIAGIHYTLNGAIYNNTFDNVDNGYKNGAWIGHDVSANVYNNIIYNSIASIGANFTGKKDYNAYFSTTSTPTEANGQIGTGSPFVNELGNDMRLSAASKAGTTFSAPYDIDVVRNARGGDGAWDRGAFEFVGNNPVLVLSPPQNLRQQ
ncbi:hypothetical protein [Methylobacter svalbardensis]|uniref:hypothetical protein n=1 Tax=Methylobacter svalbardensis TaxID=3080016 RepID=UPI0030EE1652